MSSDTSFMHTQNVYNCSVELRVSTSRAEVELGPRTIDQDLNFEKIFFSCCRFVIIEIDIGNDRMTGMILSSAKLCWWRKQTVFDFQFRMSIVISSRQWSGENNYASPQIQLYVRSKVKTDFEKRQISIQFFLMTKCSFESESRNGFPISKRNFDSIGKVTLNNWRP